MASLNKPLVKNRISNRQYFKEIAIISAVVLFVLLSVSCSKEKDPVGHSSISIDMGQLENARDIAGDIANIKSLLIQQDTTLLVESYFHGADENFKDDVMSVTKSFMSALIGMAIDKGYIDNIDQPLSDYLSDVVDLDEQRGAITIRQLLMMSCGLEWHGLSTSTDYIAWRDTGYQLDYILDKPFDHAPGTDFNYSDGDAHLLSVILTEATGMSAHNFARRYLFDPLGFGLTVWSSGAGGYNIGSTRLQVTPRDMLKLGLLYLNEGKLGDEQVISSEWIRASTETQISTRDALPYGPGYGYLWWVGRVNAHDIFFANGFGGQFIVVVPDLKVVVVTTAEWRYYDQIAGQYWYEIIQVIMEEILPAFNR